MVLAVDLMRVVDEMKLRILEIYELGGIKGTSTRLPQDFVDIISALRHPIIRQSSLFAMSSKSLLEAPKGEGSKNYHEAQLEAIVLRLKDIPLQCRHLAQICERLSSEWDALEKTLTTAFIQAYPRHPSVPWTFTRLISVVSNLIWSYPELPNYEIDAADNAVISNLFAQLQVLRCEIIRFAAQIEVFWRKRLDAFANQTSQGFTTMGDIEFHHQAWMHLHSQFSNISTSLYAAGSIVASIQPGVSKDTL